jgi:starch-binding outer membrane protein SusE/F
MKNIISKSIYAITLFSAFFVACEDVDTIQLDSTANTVVSLSEDNVVLSEDTADDNAVTISWTEPNFGFDAAPSYTIMMDVSGGDFTAAQLISAGSDYNYVFTVAQLNNKLLSLGLSPNEESSVDIRVKTTLSAFQEMISESVTLVVTPYSSILDLSTNLGVVGNATAGGWGNENIPDLPFYTTATAYEYVAYVTLADGEIKFRKDNSWAENFGDTGADGTLEADGDNIAVTAGTYKITVNMATLTYTMESYSWGIVGSATPNGWGAPDVMLHYNPFSDDWRTVITLVDGDAKFRFNEDWAINYGDTGADGSLEIGGDNIAVSAGHYLVTFNLNTLEYSFE